mmetsp:Transcript_2454/g.9399  ORF Transcript_2454/g.9399 Transcript_2454/m.9399 type:complete len:357 (+) Transcript_2454:42-1112(+)
MGATFSRCEEAGALPPLPPPEIAELEGSLGTSRSEAAAEKLKTPGQFERLQEDVKKLTSVNTFEGCRFDVSKPLTPMFALSHSFQLGASPYPNASSHYKFGSTVGDAERVCIASVDQYGSVEGQLYGTLVGGLQGKLIFNLPADPKGFVAVSDLDYNGATHSAQLKLAQNVHGVAGPHVGVSYFQAITPRLALGGEGACSLGAGFAEGKTSSPAGPATVVAAARYSAPNYAGILSYATASGGKGGDAGNGGTPDQLSLLYHRVVSPGRVQLASELAVQPATGEAQMAAGAEFALKQSRVNLALDGQGKCSTTVETTLSPAAKLTFSAEMHVGGGGTDDLGKPRDLYKFGYGLQIGQ